MLMVHGEGGRRKSVVIRLMQERLSRPWSSLALREIFDLLQPLTDIRLASGKESVCGTIGRGGCKNQCSERISKVLYLFSF